MKTDLMKKYLDMQLLSIDLSRKIARLLFFFGGIGTVGFSYLFQLSTGAETLLWDRWLVGFILLGFFAASFTPLLPKAKVGVAFGVAMVLMTIQSVYANFQMDFPAALLITELLIVQYFFLVITRKVQIWGYFTLVNLSWIIGMAASGASLEWGLFVSSVVFLISLANAVVGVQRVEAFEALRKQKQKAARSQQTLHAVLESSQDLIWSVDSDFRLRVFNQAFGDITQQLFGFWPEPGMEPIREAQAPGLPPANAFDGYYAQAIAEQRSLHTEIEFELDGETRWFSINFNPIFSGERVTGLANFARDITVLKKRSADLLKFRKAIEGTSEAIGIADPKGQIIYLNPAFERLTGYSIADINRVGIPALYGEPAFMEQKIRRLQQSGEEFQAEVILHTQAGQPLTIDLKVNGIFDDQGEMIGLMGLHTDITERRRMEKEIKQTQQRYALAIEGVNDGLWDWNLLTGEVYLSPRFKSMAGYADDELPNDTSSWHKLIHPEDREWVIDDLKAHIQGKTEQAYGEFRLRHKDGHSIWVLGRGKCERDAKGWAIRMTGSHTDITERRQLQASLQGVLDSSLSGIMAFRSVRDGQGEIIDFEWTLANKAATRMVGFSQDELINRRLLEVMPGNDKTGLFKLYKEVVETGMPIEMEHFYDHEKVEKVWFRNSVVKLEDGFAVTFSDITESKKREEERHTLSLVASKTEAAVVITDANQVIEWVNDGYCRLTGYSFEEVVGLKAGAVMQGDATDQATSRAIGENLRAGRSATAEILNYRKDGTPYWIALNINPIFDQGKVVRYIAVETDITARKEAEKALLLAKESAERAAMAKADFLATMSHEIRTPMNAVIGMTGLLRETQLSEEQREYVETIRLSGDNLLTIINDILDFSKIDAGKMELESQPFHLRSAIEDVLDLLAGKAHQQRIELLYEIDCEVPEIIEGDPTRLNQVLVNLTNNAIKFTEEEGEVFIRVKKLSRRGKACELEISVTDTGIGIPPERAEQLFQPFSQVDASTTRKYGGTGLGLVISRRLVELMGGSIQLESEVGKGSVFSFTFKTQESAQRPEECLPAANWQALEGKTLLLVDDNPTNLRVLERLLQRYGLHTYSTTEPRACLELLEAHPEVEGMILDMQMPGMDGLSLARQLKAAPAWQHLPLILLTSMHELPKEDDQLLFGAMLHKPVRHEHLFRQLTKLLSSVTGPAQAPVVEVTPSVHSALAMPVLSVLLVEDNLINQKVALRMLSKLGYEADVAANGLEAIKAMEMRSYDLIFMDMQMPEMDGLTATRELRLQHPPAPEGPVIIAMTANALKGDRERCLEAGMDDYISKPIKKDNIQEAILGWFGEREQA